MILVTGGAGFIGANFVLDWLAHSDENVVNIDLLTYAGNLSSLSLIAGDPRHTFVHGDVSDLKLIQDLLARHRPRAIVHFAAETHVDRSISSPEEFFQTNVIGTMRLLQAARSYWGTLGNPAKKDFRFLHVSTDEVYGSLSENAPPFSETDRYEPNSPYSASKASSDHIVRAYHQTYGLPVLTTNCSNNYGPYQNPEKLIPATIIKALANDQLALYGDGLHQRDWLYVKDHCAAIRCVLESGAIGEVYNIGSSHNMPNISVVQHICALLDEMRPRADKRSYREQINKVADRPGHDRRYAVDTSKIQTALGWKAQESFEAALRTTVSWYLDNADWVYEIQGHEGCSLLKELSRATVSR